MERKIEENLNMQKKIIFTIGHSNREFEDFSGLLKKNKIELLADVRSLPGSKYVPKFNQENLEKELPKKKIAYEYFKDLGGRRKALPEKESKNIGWKNKSFRAYADYMQTEEFVNALEELIKIIEQKRTTIMCAEAVPWRCHRNLISDALFVRGFSVREIISKNSVRDHKVTPFAKISGEKIIYPPET
jgi:uncharacterized protein (DUF488 family)